jgi:hypothetical protein
MSRRHREGEINLNVDFVAVPANPIEDSRTFAAFVEMQYFGYLRRNPQDPPNTDLSGFNFWLNKLNEFGGDFRRAEMVKAFLVSGEYRQRFGPN